MTQPVEITFACPAPSCGKPVVGSIAGSPASLACTACSAIHDLPEWEQAIAAKPFAPCPVCGSADLYAQRDFNRKLGLSLAAIGLLLGPFTAWISTIVAIGLDALLYLAVPSVGICYACNAQFRHLDRAQRPAGFEIALHDVYKFGRRHPPRPERTVAGPRALRLAYTGEAAEPAQRSAE